MESVVPTEMPPERHALYSDVAEFGAVSLIYDIANLLGITEIIDGIFPKRKRGLLLLPSRLLTFEEPPPHAAKNMEIIASVMNSALLQCFMIFFLLPFIIEKPT